MEASLLSASELHDRLLERAKKGDRVAIEALLTPHLPRLHAFLRRNLDPALAQRESAADLLQATCVEVLSGLPRFDGHGEGDAAFRRWLYRATLRKLRDRQRFHRRRKRNSALEVSRPDDSLLELALTTATPGRRAAGAEERRRVRAALQELPQGYREILQAVYFEGMTVGEVATAMRKSRTAVYSLLARALARLARVLED